MQQQHRLSRNRQFSYVYRRGAKASNKDITLLYVRNAQQRVGFSVSKKVGGAVVRNLTKRRLRECMRLRLPGLKYGLYVLVAHPCAAERNYAQLEKSVEALLHKLALHRGEQLPPPPNKP